MERHVQCLVKVKITAEFIGFKILGPVHNRAFARSHSPFLRLTVTVKLDGLRKILQFNFKYFRTLSASCCSQCGQELTLGFENFSRVVIQIGAGNYGFRRLLSGILLLTDEGKPGFAS